MKKDYVPIPEDELVIEESAFVERFWHGRWHGVARLPNADIVARKEEFRLMEPFLLRLEARARILDAGCGLGEWTAFLTRRGYEVIGLDLDSGVLERLRSEYPHCQFRQGDVRATGFPDGYFDAAFAWGVFEHFENGPTECLREAGRILKSGGWLFITVPFQNWRHLLRDARPLEKWDHTFDSRTGYSGPQRFYQWRFTRPELQRELERHRFQAVRLAPIGKREGVRRWMEWDVPWFKERTRVFQWALQFFTRIFPAALMGHMLMAVARKRD